ncbi:DUF2786 domain-containing protein [Eubacteriaceae bacterium ES2]|nr:DUF2786 domain-containing protein [Eubacteriaceae bacterium ES2]
MSDQNIKERISKLLALGTSPNEHEANSAITKAKRLMAEYKFTEDEFDVSKSKTPIEIKSEIFYTTRKNRWISDLAGVIAENSCCAFYLKTAPRKQKHYIAFRGFENDVEICNTTFEYAIDCVNGLLKENSKEEARKNGTKKLSQSEINIISESYAIGFVHGLKESYRTQNEYHQEWGLVMQVPKEVTEYVEDLKPASWKNNRQEIDQSFYRAGYEEGENFNMRDKLNYTDCSNFGT